MPIKTLLAVVFILVAPDGLAAPLFESDEPLVVTIEAPMRALIRKRLDKDEYPATVSYVDSSGQQVSVPAEISARGNHRLETCSFPPLRLEFEREDVPGTIFLDQHRLKMVTPCGGGSEKRSWLLLEQGIYRAYNAVTDASFRVRRIDVSFRDTESKRWEREYPGFLIESIDGAANRLGYTPVRPPNVRDDQFRTAAIAETALFQYLIANTDFAVKKGPSGEGCCHNGRVLSPPGRQHEWVVLPYDFDQAGIINTDYALPDRRLGISGVNTRLYRGFCWHNHALPAAIDKFNARRDEITAALIPEELSNTKKRRTGRFIDRFYEIVNDPEELEKRVIGKCRGASSFEIRASTPVGE